MIELPHIHKPSYGVRLNRQHPLAQNLESSWIANEAGGNILFDSCKNKNGSLINSVDWSNDGIVSNGSDSYFIADADATGGEYNNTTVMFTMSPVTSIDARGFLQWANENTDSSPFFVIRQIGTSSWRIYIDNSYRYTSPSNQIVVGKKIIITVSNDNGNWKFYQDGVKVGEYSGGAANNSSAVSLYMGQGYGGYSNAKFENCLLWYRTLSDAEIFSITKNPYQIFESEAIYSFPLIGAEVVNLLDGKILIKNSAINLLDNKIQISDISTTLLDGLLKVQNISITNLDCKVIIKDIATDVLDGKCTIKDITTDILDGKVIVRDLATDLLDGKLIVQDDATDLLDSKILIQKSLSNLLDGKVTIQSAIEVINLLDGKLIIESVGTGLNLLDSKVTIKNVATNFLDGLIIIQNKDTDLLDSKIIIKNTQTLNLDSKVTIKDVATDLLDGKLILKTSALNLLDGKLDITSADIDIFDAKINIQDDTTVILDGKVFITTGTTSNILDGKIVITELADGKVQIYFSVKTPSISFEIE